MYQPLKLKPALKDYIWGGDRLIKDWNKSSEKNVVAESWEMSCHNGGPSVIDGGEYDGKLLKDVINADMLGENAKKFEFFPILVKLIDAKDNLSIQVHPDDDYALKNEGEYGKTEMWYVVEANEGAGVYCGFNKEYTKDEVKKALKDGVITDILNFIEVKSGDTLFINSGTVHAICGGLLIAEIQQNSSLTYRLFDYNRVDKDGNKRELHIAKSIDVIDSSRVVSANETVNVIDGVTRELAKCKYFTAYVHSVNSTYDINVTEESFVGITAIGGVGNIEYNGVSYPIEKGDTYFIPAGMGKVTLKGAIEAISYRV